MNNSDAITALNALRYDARMAVENLERPDWADHVGEAVSWMEQAKADLDHAIKAVGRPPEAV